MKLLFVGESWLGSDARTLKEALARIDGVSIDEVNEDVYYPLATTLRLRLAMRVLGGAFRRQLFEQVRRRAATTRPDAILIVKGTHFDAGNIEELKSLGPKVAVRYPDYSPLIHGERSRRSIDRYDLVLSAKPFHPAIWQSGYGYTNRCVCVPHGYNPRLHLKTGDPGAPVHDVVMIASARPEYVEVLTALARDPRTAALDVVVGGDRWSQHRKEFPAHWRFIGPAMGESYVETLRSAKIALAPITTEVNIGGRAYPGDVDTARTYELAAARCFFIHRRSDYLQSIYDERSEVPLFSDGDELVEKILHYLPRDEERRQMASAAQARAVPAYSIDARAVHILDHLRAL